MQRCDRPDLAGDLYRIAGGGFLLRSRREDELGGVSSHAFWRVDGEGRVLGSMVPRTASVEDYLYTWTYRLERGVLYEDTVSDCGMRYDPPKRESRAILHVSGRVDGARARDLLARVGRELCKEGARLGRTGKRALRAEAQRKAALRREVEDPSRPWHFKTLRGLRDRLRARGDVDSARLAEEIASLEVAHRKAEAYVEVAERDDLSVWTNANIALAKIDAEGRQLAKAVRAHLRGGETRPEARRVRASPDEARRRPPPPPRGRATASPAEGLRGRTGDLSRPWRFKTLRGLRDRLAALRDDEAGRLAEEIRETELRYRRAEGEMTAAESSDSHGMIRACAAEMRRLDREGRRLANEARARLRGEG